MVALSTQKVVRARPSDAKVNEWLKQVRKFVRNKVHTICRFCMVIYAYSSVTPFQVS